MTQKSKKDIQRDIVKGFVKATAANVPLAGSYITEAINFISEKTDAPVLEARLEALTQLVLNHTPDELKADALELLATPQFIALKGQLNNLYFGNGSDKTSAHEVFVHAWLCNAFDGIDELENQDRLNFLSYISGSFVELRSSSKLGNIRNISIETTNKLLDLLYLEIEKLEMDFLRQSDLASLNLTLGKLLFETRRYRESAMFFMSCVEQAVFSGQHVVQYGDGSGLSLPSIIGDIGSSFQNIKLYDLAICTYQVQFKIFSDDFGGKYKLGIGTAKPVYDKGHLHAIQDQVEEALASFQEYLALTDFLAENAALAKNKHLWSPRKRCAKYIIRNSGEIYEQGRACLCGSKAEIEKCCGAFE